VRPSRAVVLAALGVVYGDIGTSPLYAIRECFHGPHAIAATRHNVLGVLSLIVWSLLIVISVKYLTVVMRADNRGEGGILALMALVTGPERSPRLPGRILVLMGLFGAALLYGDGIVTPAISVLSAVEGLSVAAPALDRAVLPITIVILVALFAVQRRGTRSVGALFGPVTLLWFVTIALLGLVSVARSPEVLQAFNPALGVEFLFERGLTGVLVMGTVFLVVTGGESLYTDMGHFGPRPIRRAWFTIVLPSLLANYMGQSALLLRQPALAESPFYHLAPSWGMYPLVALATAATAVAAQAVITGAYSVTWQAIQLGYLPRVRVQHTSQNEIGQIYIASVNYALLVLTIGLVLGFRSSSNLVAAYGVAVTTTMVITSMLIFVAMRRLWHWRLPAAAAVAGLFFAIDLTFFGANIVKIPQGGWFPLVIGVLVMTLMTTWSTGRRLLGERLRESAVPLDEIWRRVEVEKLVRTPRTVVFMTGHEDSAPPALLRLMTFLDALPERIVLLTVATQRVPHVRREERCTVEQVAPDVHRIVARYGFMEIPNVPRVLRMCRAQGLDVDPNDVVYVLGRETLFATERPGMALWRESLFAFMARNAGRPTDYFRIPPRRVLEIGAQIQL
jgi:KUP system potassium uptake protein